MYSRKNIEDLVIKFKELASESINIKNIYLFGSYANDTANSESDIDIAVVSDEFKGSRFYDRKKLNKYIMAVSSDLEVHPFASEDFSEENPFIKTILDTGIKLV